MNILYPHLLYEKSNNRLIENIVCFLIERVVCGSPPFLTEIRGNILYAGSKSLDLYNSTPIDLENFLRQYFMLYQPQFNWKDIRKHSIRNILLYKYAVNRPNISLLELHLLFAAKTICNEHVVMDSTKFKIKVIKGIDL